MATMRALRYHGAKDLRLEDIPIPEVKPGQVKVKPAWCGICGTDLHEYVSGPILFPAKPHPITGESVPIGIGHEFSGTVEEIGSGVKNFKVGDRVILEPIIFDGDCTACQAGSYNCCSQNGFVGISGWGGGFAEAIVLDEKYLNHMPDGVSLQAGALIEPLAVAVRAVRTSGVKPPAKVLMLGGGPIGLVVVLVLKALGITNIVVSEPSAARRGLNEKVGASAVLDPTSFPVEEFPKHVMAAFHGSSAGKGDQLADVAFDCAGVPASLEAAFSGTKPRATIVNVAVWEKPPAFPMNLLVFREKTYKGTAAPEHEDFEGALKLLRDGKIKDSEKIVTKRIKLADIVQEGFVVLTKPGGTSEGKVLVEIAGGE